MDQELKVKITADSAEVKTGMDQAQSAVTNAVSGMKDSFGGLGGALDTLKSSWALMAIGVNQALEVMNKAIEIPRKLMQWGEMGAQLSRTEESFRAVAAQAGYSADAIVSSLQRASKGTLDAATIMQRSGRLMQEGIAPEKLTTLMDLLQKQAPIVGDTMKEAWDKVGESLSMGTTRALRHYVGIIDLDKEYQKFAASIGTTKDRLTEEAKQMVMVDTVTRKLQETTKGITSDLNQHAIQMEKNKAIAKDSWDAIYKAMMPVGELLSSMYAKMMLIAAGGWSKERAIIMTGEGTAEATGGTVGTQTGPAKPTKLVADRDPQQQAEWDKKRLEIQSQILKLQEDERGAIIKKYDAEIAGELDMDKRRELQRLKAAEIAAFDKKQAEEISTKSIESWKAYIEEREKQDNDVARLEGELRIKSNAEEQKNREQGIEAAGKAQDEKDAKLAEALALDVEITKRTQTLDLENQIRVNNEATANAQKYYQRRYELGEINASELARVETQLEASRYGAELDLLNQLSALYLSNREKYQEYLNQKRTATEVNAKNIQDIELNSTKNVSKFWKDLSMPIVNAFDTTVTGIIMGTTTLQKGIQNIFRSIILDFVNLLVKKMIDEWLVGELTKLNISKMYAAIRTALMAEETTSAQAMKAQEATTIITADAGEAAAGAAASQASIPYIGPILAVAAAATMLALVLGYKSFAKAAGGWDVDRDQLAMVHGGEMVLPASIATGFKTMFANQGAGGNWKPNNRMFRDLGRAFGAEHGREFMNSLKGSARKMGIRR